MRVEKLTGWSLILTWAGIAILSWSLVLGIIVLIIWLMKQ